MLQAVINTNSNTTKVRVRVQIRLARRLFYRANYASVRARLDRCTRLASTPRCAPMFLFDWSRIPRSLPCVAPCLAPLTLPTSPSCVHLFPSLSVSSPLFVVCSRPRLHAAPTRHEACGNARYHDCMGSVAPSTMLSSLAMERKRVLMPLVKLLFCA